MHIPVRFYLCRSRLTFCITDVRITLRIARCYRLLEKNTVYKTCPVACTKYAPYCDALEGGTDRCALHAT
ncbi:hypothetical protein EG68_01997 [Paragonimus skrjabini miyazakii]|uniref:Uncharacterized protein n=1 Tax=Paragonimus skrjabini miyazakii TaxID=59628 RepID=A0A8S9Z6M4_9TREM|nr:hypothetical protein EG68_01997 [Paragonimus skrjabini miyazakii]